METLRLFRRTCSVSSPDAPTVRWRATVWTSRPPETPGLYHHRSPGEPGKMRLASIRRNAAGVLVARFAHGEELVATKSGEWAGPLTLTLDE